MRVSNSKKKQSRKKAVRHIAATSEDLDSFLDSAQVTCASCGHEQPDMGRSVACENCGAAMPT